MKSMIMMAMMVVAVAITSSVSGTQLICNYGAITKSNRTCTTQMNGTSPYNNQVCTQENHTCMTAKYAGDWFAAYGCYPNSVVQGTQAFWQSACANDPDCSGSNPGGTPKNGWQLCNTDNCNSCNSASFNAPSWLLLTGLLVTLRWW